MAACSKFDESSYKTPRFGSGQSTSPAASNHGFHSSSCERSSGASAISAGVRGSLPPLKFGEHAGKNTSSSNSSACNPAYLPKLLKRIATSTSSRVKSVSVLVERDRKSVV